MDTVVFRPPVAAAYTEKANIHAGDVTHCGPKTKAGVKKFFFHTVLILAAASVLPEALRAQVCRLSVAGLNKSRRVMGPVSAECPAPFHSAPFGNWGVTSNFGQKLDGHQFDGWCRNMQACDNLGSCRSCSGRWYEWNSCTDHWLFRGPNCSLYNARGCTEQVSTTGINVLGTLTVDIRVACPYDSDADNVPDSGGCREIESYSSGTNFMSIYELDAITGHELIQTLYFPETPVRLDCDVWGCSSAGSEWVAPIAYEDPSSPPKVFAEMAAAVDFGTFQDPNRRCTTAPSTIVSLSAASFEGALAPESIASAFGDNLAPLDEISSGSELPTELAGVRVRLRGGGREWLAPLLAVSAGQINFLVPAGVTQGDVVARVEGRGGELRAEGRLQVRQVAPGLFSANADGQGVAAALAMRLSADGSWSSREVFSSDPLGSRTAVPIDLGGETDQVFLILFGTGIRGHSGLSQVSAQVGGQAAGVLFAGPQSEFVGLDQINVGPLPRSLSGSGRVDVSLTVNGSVSNRVQVTIQ